MENNESKLRGTLHAYDWLKDIQYSPANDSDIVQVIFKNTRTGFFHNPDHLPLKKGDWVTVEASPGHDIGKVMLTGPLVALQMKKAGVNKDSELKRIFRLSTEADMEKFSEARMREHPTMIRSRQIAAELGLNMKIGDVEYQGDGAKAIFYYIADERVDFRKLIRILADTFKIRIEMKQIGARQEAGRIGGIGPCGRPLCCSTWLSRFNSVGTGAARIQDLSMNPQKLAGQCAKLKCCLNYEIEDYTEASKEFPSKDIVLITQDQEYFWFKADLLARKISYSTDKKQPVNVVTISVDRAKEIIALNKLGEKPESLIPSSEVKIEPKREFVELVGQDSLTRFDKKGKKGKKGNSRKEADAAPAATPGDNKNRKDRKKKQSPESSKSGVSKIAGNDKTQKDSKGSGNSRQRKEVKNISNDKQPKDQKAKAEKNDSGKEPRHNNRRNHHRNRPPKKPNTSES